MIYPRYHPNGVNIVVDLLLSNETQEFSVLEKEMWAIDGKDLFLEKGRLAGRTFPAWCIDAVQPRADGELNTPKRSCFYLNEFEATGSLSSQGP
jgi:hypothetical protein